MFGWFFLFGAFFPMKTEHCNVTVNMKLFYTALIKQPTYLLFPPEV